MKKRSYILFILIFAVSFSYAQNIYYVNINASGNNDGTDWVNAFTDLQDAIDNASANDEIRVATGTYLPLQIPDGFPTNQGDNYKAFHTDKDLVIKGGYVLDNDTDPTNDSQDFDSPSILSGDFNGDDIFSGSGETLTASNISENARHIIISAHLTNSSLFNNFVITGAGWDGSTASCYYNGVLFRNHNGSGMNNTNSSPTLSYITFKENYGYQGTLLIENANPILEHVIVKNNIAVLGAGGIFNAKSNASISHTHIIGNYAGAGGGMINSSSSPTLNNVSFIDNYSETHAGAIVIASPYPADSDPVFENALFVNNKSETMGGVIYNSGRSNPSLINANFINNSSASGGAIYHTNSDQNSGEPLIQNCVFYGNSSDIETENTAIINAASSYNASDIDTIGSGCLDLSNYTDEQIFRDFDNINGNDGILGTADDGLVPITGSPLVNAGLDSANSSGLDFANCTRKIGTIDIGAYELQIACVVNFVDYDGTVLKTEIVDYGNSATPPPDPTREGYSFTGWDTEFSNVTSDLTVTAQYSILQFTVTFCDFDATVLKTEIVDYGNSATPPPDPTREGYSFTGWDTEFSNVTSDLTVTAQYSILQFTVTFCDFDATVLKTEIVDYGNSATPPPDPTREGYSFTGWDTEFSNVTSDLTVTAQYSILQFTVTFCDFDATVLKTEIVDYGNSATPPPDPTREGYSFTGWDTEFSNVTSDLTVTAQYSILQFTVTFCDFDATVLKTEIVDYGNSATPPPDPTREGYSFTGWDTEFSNVTSDLTVTAQYSILQFTVTFCDFDATVLKTEIVDYGNSATPPPDPTREGYSFTGWDTEFSNVTSDLTVTAQYSILQFTVTFCDFDATVLKTEIVDYGNSAIPPPDPTREGYSFTGWDTEFSNVTSDLTVTAQYSILQFTVTFCDFDATVLKTEIVDYGNSATPPPDPTREGYSFTGWDTEFSNVTSDLTVTAQYTMISGMGNINIGSLIKIYPNPAKDYLFIKVRDMDMIQNPETGITIFNSLGKIVYQSHNIATNQTIDISNYQKGIYFITIGNETRKILVE